MIKQKTIIACFGLVLFAGCGAPSDPQAIEKLQTTEVRQISPSGELAELFFFGTDSTDLQRQSKLAELKGSVVRWNLTVFEIQKISEKSYLVSTGADPKITDILDNPRILNQEVSTQTVISLIGPNDLNDLMSYKTGDKICIKGQLTGSTTFRHLDIKPAILCKHDLTQKQPQRGSLSTPGNAQADASAQGDNCSELIGLLYRAEKLMDLCPHNKTGYVREGLLYALQLPSECGSTADPRYTDLKVQTYAKWENTAKSMGAPAFCEDYRPYGS